MAMAVGPFQAGTSQPTRGACSEYTGMCGSGFGTGTRIIQLVLLQIRKALSMANTGLFGAVVGSPPQAFAARRAAVGLVLVAAARRWLSAS